MTVQVYRGTDCAKLSAMSMETRIGIWTKRVQKIGYFIFHIPCLSPSVHDCGHPTSAISDVRINKYDATIDDMVQSTHYT